MHIRLRQIQDVKCSKIVCDIIVIPLAHESIVYNYYSIYEYAKLLIKKKINFMFPLLSGPLGNIATTYGSRGNSRANSRSGSKENLCEDCVQNPLDLVDASIQVQSLFQNQNSIFSPDICRSEI